MSYDHPVSGTGSHDISFSLAKAAIAVRIDGEIKDLATVIDRDVSAAIVTNKDPDALELIRHDARHGGGGAGLFPGTQVTIGPAIENGFYYDFVRDEPFTPRTCRRSRSGCARSSIATSRSPARSGTGPEAIRYFESIGEHYKAEIIAGIPDGEAVSVYRQGDWLDLCRGPHLPSTGKLPKAFKLTKLAGAYWRGDRATPCCNGSTAPPGSTEAAQAYLTLLEEAEKRDHRRLGREMELFHFQEEAAGSVFWHPKGWTLYRLLQDYMRAQLEAAGYVEVRTPQLYDRTLWESPGTGRSSASTCSPRSPRTSAGAEADELSRPRADLPAGHQELPRSAAADGGVRLMPSQRAVGRAARADAGARLHSGRCAHLLYGGADYRGDAGVLRPVARRLQRLRFEDIVVKFSDRPAKRAGSDETWDKAELRHATAQAGIEASLNPGEGAFYGPKLSSCCAMRSVATGNSARCRSISCYPSGSTRLTSARTARSTGR